MFGEDKHVSEQQVVSNRFII